MPPAAGLPRGAVPGGKGECVNRKKWSLVSAVLVAAGMLLFFLPALLGLRPVAALLLDRLDRRLPGTLQVEECSVGWQRPFSCRGLRWDIPQQGLRAENEDVADAFERERAADFAPLPAQQALAEAELDDADTLCAQGRLRLWPQVHGTDGFFAAAWQRR